jgi:hypothetical protein
VETPRKFITAKLSIRKPGSSSVHIISNKFTWCFHKQNYYKIFTILLCLTLDYFTLLTLDDFTHHGESAATQWVNNAYFK